MQRTLVLLRARGGDDTSQTYFPLLAPYIGAVSLRANTALTQMTHSVL